MKRLSLLAAALLIASCGEVPAPRSTVQAGAISKDDLKGTWYFRQTVVGAPFTTGFTFIGEQGDNEMEKIVWDVQEEFLVARRSYEYVRGSEKGEPHVTTNSDGQYMGAPVAAFKVQSHFDIIRDYNASTGEEYDKVIESEERKWYERRFLRVDWSQNLVSNFSFLADYSTGSVSAIKQDPVPYFVSDPNDPDALRIERPAADQPANYLEVTQKIAASPEMVTFEDGTSWPLCWLEYSTTDCASQEIKVRSSFLKVTPREYEPLAYDDHAMERAGFFTTERKSYNRQYGLTDPGRERLINRHDIWRHSLSTRACEQDSDCGSPVAGQRCVTQLPDARIDAVSGKVSGTCSLPYAARNLEDPNNANSRDLGPRPIVYYVNDTFPADLKGAAKELERQYDTIFRGIVANLTGRAPSSNVFVVCTNNPVQPGDAPECGAAGTHPRIGDLRYNQLYWVDDPTSAGLLGYGPNSNDPETGETVAATAFIYGASVDTYAAYARDLVKLVNGEMTPSSFVDGENIRAWIGSNEFGQRHKTASQMDVDEAMSGMDLRWMKGLPRTPGMAKGSAKALKQMEAARAKALSSSQVLGAESGLAARRLAKLKGTDLERKLVNAEVLLARGINPLANGGQIDLSQAAPLSLFNPERARLQKRERNRLAAHTVDMAATIDDTVLGFALAQKGKDANEVWKKVRELTFLSTALHEVGHTLGLRHNFAASYDAMNYPKTYWDLRTDNGTTTPQPRYLDGETTAELQGVQLPSGLRAGISEFMQSSIMDYGANFNSDIQGLGKYDAAALKFGYGNLVEVFKTVKDPYYLGALQATVTYGDTAPILVNCAGSNYTSAHYTHLPQWVDLEARADVQYSSLHYEKLSPCEFADELEVDQQKRMVVPYKFCSDEFEGASIGCQMFDRGADVYEVAANAMYSYRNQYFFDAFRRERLGFSPEEYVDRIYWRYFDTLRTLMQFYVLDRAYYIDAEPDDGTPSNFWRSPDGWGPYGLAVSQSFDFFGEVLMMPEPGPYYEYTGADGRDAWYVDEYGSGAPGFTLALGQGRYFNTEWEYESGYYWYERIRHIGSFDDKIAALSMMTDPETYFIGKDVAADSRQFAINYYRLYPRQTLDTFASLLTDRWDRVAPIYDGTKYVYRPISKTITIPATGISPVDPALGFTVQLWMASLGYALIPGTFDMTYADSGRLWVAGGGSTITTTLPTVAFNDPYSGKQYTAISYKSGILETGIAARMISRANELQSFLDPADPYTEAELRSYIELLEAQRSISEVYANPVW